MKCECGHELKEEVEPCFLEIGCNGCGICNDGFVTLVWCENKDCFMKKLESIEEE